MDLGVYLAQGAQCDPVRGGDALVDLAGQVRADLIILNTEHGGQRAKAQLAQEVAKDNPRVAVLIARSIR